MSVDIPRGIPSRAEIIGHVNGHGTVHAWRILRTRYGDPRGSWGPFAQMVIREHKREREAANAGVPVRVNAPANASPNAQSNAPGNVVAVNSGQRSEGTVPMGVGASVDASVPAHYSDPRMNELMDKLDRLELRMSVQQPPAVLTQTPPLKPPPAKDFSLADEMEAFLPQLLRLRWEVTKWNFVYGMLWGSQKD